MATKWFLPDEKSPAADAVLDRLCAGESAYAPTLLRWELTNALLIAERASRLSASDVDDALDAVRNLHILLESGGNRLSAGSEVSIARAYGLTSYDGAYLALAAHLGIELVTADGPLDRAGRHLGLQTTFVA